MPQVIYNKTKGLFQKAGNGFNLEGDTEGYGHHIHVEEVSLTPGANSTAAGSPSKYLPAGAVIKSVAAVVAGLGTSTGCKFAVHMHNAAVAVGAAGAGTEIIGASAGATTFPNNEDIEAGDGGVLGNGFLNNVVTDRDANVTHFHLVNGANQTSDTGTPKVTLIVEWFGGPCVDA